MNDQTAVNNYYQKQISSLTSSAIAQKAHEEFDAFVELLRSKGITVTIYQDIAEPDTPDALFPNNWISFHPNHRAIIYPMFAENRRGERTKDIFETLKNDGCKVEIDQDYSIFEKEGKFLEGTGSMVLDRVNKIAYAALSERTNKELFHLFCTANDYKPVCFFAFQSVGKKRLPIYHTNVMMSLGTNFALIGLDSIDAPNEREQVETALKTSDKTIISLTEEQLSRFAGNMLLLKGKARPLLVMSAAAYNALNSKQIDGLTTRAELVYSPLDIIEGCGGGSARCMMAEVF